MSPRVHRSTTPSPGPSPAAVAPPPSPTRAHARRGTTRPRAGAASRGGRRGRRPPRPSGRRRRRSPTCRTPGWWLSRATVSRRTPRRPGRAASRRPRRAAGSRARRSRAAPPSRAGRARGRATRRRAPSRAARPGRAPRGTSPGASCGGRARTAPPACASCRGRRRPRARRPRGGRGRRGTAAAAPEGVGPGDRPPVVAAGHLGLRQGAPPGQLRPPGRVPARTLGPGVFGEVPGLPGRATRAPPVQWRARRGAPAAGGGDARRERSRVRRHGASPPRGRGGRRPPGRPRPRRARRPRRAWRARRRTRRRARARHRRPSSPPRRQPRTQRSRRHARWPPGPGAPAARRGVDGRHEVLGHFAAYGRLHGRPRPRDDRRHEGGGASDGPAPRHLGRVATRRLRSASMSTPLSRTPTTRPRSCQAGPAQQGSPPARAWPRLSDLAPSHPAGSKRTPGRDTVAAKSTGSALVADSPDLLREAGSVRSQPTCGLASGPAADATDGTGTRRLPVREADGVPDGPPLVSRVGVAEPRPEAAAGPRLREQPRLGRPSEEHPTGLGRVAGHHHARHPADEPEDPGEPLAETLRPLAPRRHAVPRPRSRGAAAGGSGPRPLPAITATKLPQASRVVPGAQPGPG